MTDPTGPVKRLHYFDYQFLQKEDFSDEQEYHISMRRLHNQYLHTWGVAQGLEVVVNDDLTSVTITPGVAIDSSGREIWLKNPIDSVPISGFDPQEKVFITILYKEKLTDDDKMTGESNSKRYTENDPNDVIVVKAKSNPDLDLILGQINMDDSGNKIRDKIVDVTLRRLASVKGGDMEMHRLTLTELQGKDNKLKITTGVIINGDLEIAEGSGSLKAKLGTDTVGADQVIEKSIPLKKLVSEFIKSSVIVTLEKGQTRTEGLDTSPLEKAFYLVLAYPMSGTGSFSWKEILEITAEGKVSRSIQFSHLSGSDLVINYTIWALYIPE